MSNGRTFWRAKDAAWHDREWIVTLVDEFGPAGYAVADCLESMAKMQNDGGRVKTGPRAVARATGADVVTVGHVVSRAVTLGLLVDYEERDTRFECVVAWFAADQGSAMAATRKARQRANAPIDPDDLPPLSRSVTDGHGESRSVPECPTTGQDRTEQPSAKAERARKRANRRVDQSKRPDDFPEDLVDAGRSALQILHRVWDDRGGVEPQPRGVGLAIMRNPRADHVQVARELEHWLTAGKGLRARCDDIAKRFGDWVADAAASGAGGTHAGASVHPLRPGPRGRETASDWLRDIDAGGAA